MADHYTRQRNLRVFTAIMAATLTTVGALSVVFFLDDATRMSLQDFVVVVIINLIVSLAVALLLVPALVKQLGIRRRVTNGRRTQFRNRTSLLLSRLYMVIVRFLLRFRKLFMIIIALFLLHLPVSLPRCS